jgi:hypothetical protein
MNMVKGGRGQGARERQIAPCLAAFGTTAPRDTNLARCSPAPCPLPPAPLFLLSRN